MNAVSSAQYSSQNVSQCIHQFITDFLNMAAIPVWIEIYKYVIKEIMIVPVKKWKTESIRGVSSVVSEN